MKQILRRKAPSPPQKNHLEHSPKVNEVDHGEINVCENNSVYRGKRNRFNRTDWFFPSRNYQASYSATIGPSYYT